MKNTLENKAKFRAQYYGQKVLRLNGSDSIKRIGSDIALRGLIDEEGFYLELTPLSQITDEDAKNIEFVFNVPFNEVELTFDDNLNWIAKYNGLENYGVLFLRHIDYLRSKGYALPYMGLSVDQQMEYGWIKLNDL